MVDPGKKVSDSYSLKGWNVKDWFRGNGKTLKELVKIGVPLLVVWAQTNNPALIGFFTVLGKLVCDSIEYYIKEY